MRNKNVLPTSYLGVSAASVFERIVRTFAFTFRSRPPQYVLIMDKKIKLSDAESH